MSWAEKCFRDQFSRATSLRVEAKELFLVGIDLANWGERRRVDLARALLANPTIALMVIDAPETWALVTTEARIVLAAARLGIKPAPYPFTLSTRHKINPAVSAERAVYAAQLEADASVSQLSLAEVTP